MRHTASKAEHDFMSTLMGEKPMRKVAADLDPETADALGVQTVSPSILKQLDQQAASTPTPTPAPAPDPVEQEAQAELEAAQVDQEPTEPIEAFDRADEAPVAEEPAPEPELPRRSTHGRLFADKRAHPLQILDVLTMRYKNEWAEWEPDTLWWALRRDFGPVGEVTRNKVMALQVAVTTDVPWLDWDVFEDSGISWNDNIPTIGAFQPMSPMQTAFTVQVLRGIRDDEEFDNEVKAYIAAILEDHGWVYAPEEYFANAQELLDRKVWLVGFKKEVEGAWAKIRDVDPATIEWRQDNPLDIHLLKLMVVKQYVDGRNALREVVPGGRVSSSTVSPPVP